MRTSLIIVSIVAVLLGVAAGYCFVRHTQGQAELSQLRLALTSTQAELAGRQAELAGRQAELTSTQAELADIQKVYPLRNFASRTEMEQWMRSNTLPQGRYAEDSYQNAIQTQMAAMRDGYLVGIQIDSFANGNYWVGNAAIADGGLYHFKIETGYTFRTVFP